MYLLIPLRSSRILNTLYCGQCVLALMALAWAAPPLWLYCVCAALFLVEVVRWLLRPRAIGLIVSDSGVQLNFKDKGVPVRLEPHCFCNPYLIVLRFVAMPCKGKGPARVGKGRRYTVLILPDTCPSRLHRQLRMALRWYRFDERVLLL